MNTDALKAMLVSMGYTDETVIGGGAIKGSPCEIKSIEPIEGGNRITYKWTLQDYTERTATVDVMNGEKGKDGKDGSIASVEPILKMGTKIAVITIDGVPVSLYAPTGGSGSDTLDGLDDVDLTFPSDGQVLKYNEELGMWVNADSSGEAVLSDDLTTAISVGGIDSGATYEKGTPLETLFRDLLEPTLFPSLTAPSASLSYGANSYYAVKTTVSALSATVSLNRGSISPAYGTDGKRAGEATGYSLSTSGADTEFSDTNVSGSFNVPTLTRSTKGSIVVTGTASYAQGAQPKDSKGNNYQSPLPAGSVIASKTLNFIQPYYYGASNSAVIADFTGLNESVTAKSQKTFAFTTSNQYQVFAYDSSYGNLKSILDPNGFETISGWNKSTVTVGGFSYYVYVTASPTTDTNASFTFKY